MEAKIEFGAWDKMVLLAILRSGGTGADIVAMISTIDHLDHSIISYEELRDALIKLGMAGLVSQKDSSYRATMPVEHAFNTERDPRRSHHKDLEVIEAFLEGWNCGPDRLQQGFRKKGITTQAYERALKEYKARQDIP